MASEKYFRYPPDWELTQESLKEIMSYCPESGEFRWRVSPNHKVTVGMLIVGKSKGGYRRASINSVRYYLHRLTFLYMNGLLPEDLVDHIDGNRNNNAWNNLREVSFTDSNRNLSKPSTNTSGTVGVYWDKNAKKWSAKIYVNNTSQHLGLFLEKKDAISARQVAEVSLGYHKNHGREQ